MYKSPHSTEFKAIEENDNVYAENGIITVNEIPTVIQLKINKVLPDNAGATKKILLDGEPVLSLDENVAEITIEENKEYIITMLVEDVNRDMKTEKIFKVGVEREDIIGKLLITPDTVGTDPFTVRFDASISQINDPEDKIVYFTWDFGDGNIKTNVSQAVVNHTYTYDFENENGIYDPTVTWIIFIDICDHRFLRNEVVHVNKIRRIICHPLRMVFEFIRFTIWCYIHIFPKR